MDETKWLRWLMELTGEESIRGIGRAVGRSHTTVLRWLQQGVPDEVMWELTVRFRGDPGETLMVAGNLDAEDLANLNHEAAVKYIPTHVLAAELHRRAQPVAPEDEAERIRRMREW